MALKIPFIVIFLLLSSAASFIVASEPLVIEIHEGIKDTPHETGDVDQTIATSFVHTVDATHIRKTQLDAAQIIENMPGIKIRKIGGLGSISLASIRGKASDQTMIYLDGMLLNNASGGSVDLSRIPASQVARIEVYKDIVPIEFSQASNGGIINIISHRSNTQNKADVSIGTGSFSTYKANFNTQANINKWSYVLSGGYIESENNYPFNYENGTFENASDDEIQSRHNNQLKQHSIIAKAKYIIDAYQSLHYQGESFSKRKQLPSIKNSDNIDASLDIKDRYFQTTYINRRFASNRLAFNASFKADIKSTIFDDSEKQISLEKKYVTQDIKSISGKVYFKFTRYNYQFINSNSLRYEHLSLNDTFNPEDAKTNNRRTIATAIQGNFYFNDKKLIISPAGRFFISQDSFQGETLTESGNTTRLDKQFSTISPQFGMRYLLSPESTIKMNAGSYYRLPNYVELFGTRGYIGSNESLKPEKGINFDAGFEFSKYTNSDMITKLDWTLAIFHSIIEDEIIYTFNSRGEGKPSNNRRSTITGIENNLNIEINYDVEFVSNTTLQLPINQSNSDEKKLLAGRPILSQSTRVQANFYEWNFFLEHIFESFYYYDSEQRLPSNQKSIINSGLSLHYKKVQIDLEANNIFNQYNKDYYFQVSPGRSVFLTSTLKFK